MSIYSRINDLAKQKKISIRQLEQKMGFANGSMRKWTDNANPERLKKVADYLGTTPAYLRGEDTAAKIEMILKANAAAHISSGKTESTLSNDSARLMNRGFGEVIEKEHIIPPYMALIPDDVSTFPVIGSIKAGPNGVAFEDYQGTNSTSNIGLSPDKTYFYLKVSGNSMTGDGIHNGDLALIEKADTVEEQGAIYAVIYDGELGTLKHVTKTDSAIVLSASNPAYKPIVIPADECEDQFWVVGKLKQVTKNF